MSDLFDSVQMGPHTLANRIVMAPLTRNRAKAHDVPFYVACPVSTIDWTIIDGIRDIPIEQRSAREVTHMPGLNAEGVREEVLITPAGTQARNDGFDVTPAALVTALITEHGVFEANAEALARLKA